MIIQNEYLSDDELQELIAETEADMVPAPPGLKEDILAALFGESNSTKREHRRQSLEFARYCIRVIATVAAAVAFIMIMPYLPDVSGVENEINFISEIQIEIRQEEVWGFEKCPTKEDVLNEKSFWEKAFGSNHKENSFIKEDGGN
ncbi:MAG: hypothetical protein IJA29_05765 [Lachnospiraceae bacterium]|nr:hypothetical protein [Lachnospiraceae bacterium]